METMLWRQKSESPSRKKELGGRQRVKGKNKGSPTLFSWYKIQVLRVLLKKNHVLLLNLNEISFSSFSRIKNDPVLT